MSSNEISNAAALLSAITPVDTTNATIEGNQVTTDTGNQATTSPQAGQQATSTPSSSLGNYNKQLLISSYLNRGKETGVGQPSSQSNPNQGKTTENGNIGITQESEKERGAINAPEDLSEAYKQMPSPKQKSTSMSQAQNRMLTEFCDMFGASSTLPKIQKKKQGNQANQGADPPTDVPDLDDASFARAVHLFNQINMHRKPAEKEKEIVDLTTTDDGSVNLFNKTSSFTKSFKLQELTFEEGVLQFDFGITPDSNAQSIPLFFHKNMQSLQGQLPLTIFNRAWQQTASNNHVDYKKGDKEIEKYRGHPFPGEWTQSRFEWGENMENFISMLRDDYKFPGFADAMEVHRKNVHRIFKQMRSWVIAFKYDLTIRKAVFAIRNPNQKVPNPALEPKGLVEEIFCTARAQDDLNMEDNPYRKGGPKCGKNPYSEILTEYPTASASTNSKTVTGPSRNWIDKKDKSQQKPSSPYGNYKGRKFDPNYKRPAEKDNLKGKGKEKEGNVPQPIQRLNCATHPPEPEIEYCSNRHSPSRDATCYESDKEDTLMNDEDSRWPGEITCEMNIPMWREALETSGLLEEYKDILHGFEFGFDQGIPHHFLIDCKWYTPPNHSSSDLAKEKISSSMKKEKAAKRIFGPFTHNEVYERVGFFRTNPMGAVVNGDGSIIPINDLSFPRNDPEIPSVNSFVNSDDFKTTWDDFAKVSSFFQNSDVPFMLALFDWEKAYRQIPTMKEQQPYMMVLDTEGNIWWDTRIGFGGVAGCGSFGRPADAWKGIMKHEFNVVEVFRWVDDALFIKTLDSKLEMKDVVKRSLELGVITNEEKMQNFKEEQKFIGFIWNGIKKTVRLPVEKLNQRREQIKEALSSDKKFSFNDVEVLTGRLVHVTLMLPQLKCYMTSLYRWKKSWVHKYATQKLPQDVKMDLMHWKLMLSDFEQTRLIRFSDPIDIGWVGDASPSYGVGVLIGKKWFQVKLKPGWENSGQIKRGIAWLETVAIRIGLWHIVSNGSYKGKTLIVWTDNTTSQNAILNRRSNDLEVNKEWRNIQQILISCQIDLTAKRVISKKNDADDISRGEGKDHNKNETDRVWVSLPSDLINCFNQNSVKEERCEALERQFPGLDCT